MDNKTIESLVLNNTNITCTRPLLWSQAAADSRASRLYVCIIASILYSIFWLHLAFCSSVRQTSMQWIYAYLTTDILLLSRFFFLYIIGTTSTECEPSQSWVLFICIFQTTIDNYLNILEVYILLALNICSCDIRYTNIYAQILKVIVGFVLPVILNILVIYANKNIKLVLFEGSGNRY
jgi:hypothetical protein